jgi:hypothetical protein
MKNVGFISLLVFTVALSTTQGQPVDEASGQKTLAATMKVYVFPTQGQDAQRQSKDEAECYGWAVDNTGDDPFELAKKSEADRAKAEADQAKAQQAGAGEGARSAVRGAAVGALIGEIADDDPGEGAAYGAAAGLIRGSRRGRRTRQQAQQSAAQKAERTEEITAEQIEGFKKAFSVCLEAKDYMVKY